ncbi:MAG: hypothetical protein NC938_03495, partial [Candidatus Omnitrophica bacterium]|nr:hypothetical protein [Candidatus Omnitrophota bacterium]
MTKLAVRDTVNKMSVHTIILNEAKSIMDSSLVGKKGVFARAAEKIKEFLGMKRTDMAKLADQAVNRATENLRGRIGEFLKKAEVAGESKYDFLEKNEAGDLVINVAKVDKASQETARAINNLLSVFGDIFGVRLREQMSSNGAINQLEMVLGLISKGLNKENIKNLRDEAALDKASAETKQIGTGAGKTYAILNAYMYLTRALFSQTTDKSILTLPPALLAGSYDANSFPDAVRKFGALGYKFDLLGDSEVIGFNAAKALNSGDLTQLTTLQNRAKNADIIVTVDSVLQQSLMNCLNQTSINKAPSVRALEVSIYKTLTSRVELAIDEAHFLANTVPLIMSMRAGGTVDADVVKTSMDVFFAAKSVRESTNRSWSDVAWESPVTHDVRIKADFVREVAKKLGKTAETLTAEEKTALMTLARIATTKFHEKMDGFGWEFDKELGFERACPYGTKAEIERIYSSQWEEVLTNLHAREVLGKDLGNRSALAKQLGRLRTSGDSVKAEMQQVIMDIFKNGGNVVGVTGTLAAVKSVFKFGYGLKVDAKQENAYLPADMGGTGQRKEHVRSYNSVDSVRNLAKSVTDRCVDLSGRDYLVFAAEARTVHGVDMVAAFKNICAAKGFERIIIPDSHGNFMELKLKSGQWEAGKQNLSKKALCEQFYTQGKDGRFVENGANKKTGIFLGAEDITGTDIKVGEKVGFVGVFDRKTTYDRANQTLGRNRGFANDGTKFNRWDVFVLDKSFEGGN